jgi:hypothetical protein
MGVDTVLNVVLMGLIVVVIVMEIMTIMVVVRAKLLCYINYVCEIGKKVGNKNTM